MDFVAVNSTLPASAMIPNQQNFTWHDKWFNFPTIFSGCQIGQVSRYFQERSSSVAFILKFFSYRIVNLLNISSVFTELLGISPKDLEGFKADITFIYTTLACSLAISTNLNFDLTFVTRNFIGSCVIRCVFWLIGWPRRLSKQSPRDSPFLWDAATAHKLWNMTEKKMKHLSQSDALTKSSSTEEKVSRVPLILTYHPLYTRVQRILLDNFKVIPDNPATSLTFPQPPMIAFRRDDNLRASLVHSTEKQTATRAGTYPCQHPRCRTCGHIPAKPIFWGQRIASPSKIPSFACPATWFTASPAVAALPFTSARLGALWGNVLVDISEALTRMRLVFPS